MTDENPRVLVMGVGNVLMMDEGTGNRIATELQSNYVFPDDVAVADCGTMGLGMMHLFRGVEFLLVADAIDGTGHPAGTVVRTSPENFSPNQVMHSLHDVRLVDVLSAARLIDVMPEAECVGVQIENMSPEEMTIGLTPVVESAIPRAVAAVLYILREHGVEPELAIGEQADPDFQAQVSEALEDITRRQGEAG